MLRDPLGAWSFARVISSPLSRARDTCELAGLGERAELSEALLEWDYGEYEGITTASIREGRPGWVLWRDGCPGGETAAQVGARVDPLVDELRGVAEDEDVALFAHGHLLRVLTARWLGLPPEDGRLFALVGRHALRARLRARAPRDQAVERARRLTHQESGRGFRSAPTSAISGMNSPAIPSSRRPFSIVMIARPAPMT